MSQIEVRGTVRGGTKAMRFGKLASRYVSIIPLLIAGISASGSTFAQGTPPSAPMAKSDVEIRVEKLYNDGVAAANKKQWEKARASFEEAFKLDPRPQIAANLGNAELELGKAREAAEHFELFLREDKKAGPNDRAGVKALLDRALAKIAVLQITVDADGAEVFVDGRSLGKSPLVAPIYVEPGSYTIEAKLAGRTPASQRAAVTAGAKLPIELKLAIVESHQGPKVPPVKPPVEPAWRKPLLITSIGVGIVGLGLGVGFTAAASSKNGEVDVELERLTKPTLTTNFVCPGGVETAPRCSDLAGLMNTRDKFVGVAITGYVLGGLGAASAIALSLMKPKRLKDEGTTAPKVMVLPSRSGVVVVGNF